MTSNYFSLLQFAMNSVPYYAYAAIKCIRFFSYLPLSCCGRMRIQYLRLLSIRSQCLRASAQSIYLRQWFSLCCTHARPIYITASYYYYYCWRTAPAWRLYEDMLTRHGFAISICHAKSFSASAICIDISKTCSVGDIWCIDNNFNCAFGRRDGNGHRLSSRHDTRIVVPIRESD